MDYSVESKVDNDDSVGGNRHGMTLDASTNSPINTSSPGSDEIGPGSSILPLARVQTPAPPPFIPQKNDSKRQPGNNENCVNGTPSKKARQQTSSGVLRTPLSPFKLKNAEESNDLVEETRKELVALSGSQTWLTSYSSDSITIALGRHGNDPKLAATYILSLLFKEVNANAPPSVSNTSNITSIASKTHSSIEMLSRISASHPPSDKVALGVVKKPTKNLHFFPNNEEVKKLSARAKSMVYWDDRFGKSIEEFDGKNDLEKQLMRLADAEDMLVSLVQKQPNDNGWNPSERSGTFAKCAKCEQVFPCMQGDEIEMHPSRRELASHKPSCGKTVCACGATKKQLRDKFEQDAIAKGLCKSANSISISAANHFKNCTIQASDMIDFLQSFIEKLDYGRGKMPPQGIEGLLKEKSEEERKRLRREFSPKKVKQLHGWMKGRLDGESWTSTDACMRLKQLGYDTEKVIVWDC